ncbi:MAG: PIG-L family deacetylase [Ktedonobacteraceae bacterium]|nr:PIG-L family deacetylase [Ktedonobacteraceae bacterium]
MGDRKAPGALQVVTEPDFEALVIGAHPDDDDFGTAATSALWASQGKKIAWAVMTDGTEGSEVPNIDEEVFIRTREQEQRTACELLGVKAVEFLHFHDGHLTNNDETKRAVVKLIRKYRPRVIFTHDPSQHIFGPDPDEKPDDTGYLNHPDHRATGNIVLDAIFPAAGNPRSYRDLLVEDLLPYKVHEIYLFATSQSNTFIDISETIDLKAKAILSHLTQFGPDAATDLPKRMREMAARTAKTAKEQKGLDIQYAEAFRRVKLYIPPSPKDEA